MTSREVHDRQLLADIAQFYADPLGYVMYAWPWESEASGIQQVLLAEGVADQLTEDDKRRQTAYRERFPWCEYGPDLWACDFLDQLGGEIKKRNFNGRDAVNPIQFLTISGHGIGKSVMVAWLVKFILDTRPLSMGTVTANTADQLKTKTWAAVGFWHKLSATRHLYDYSSGRGAMSLTRKSYKENWRCDAQTCREENSEAFAGQHAASATSFYIMDEGSAVPDKIYEVREGGLTDGEPMTFDFGNPTRNSGAFYDNATGIRKKHYIIRHIDSRSVRITNPELHKRWIEDYGIDSDFVKVRVLGQFPSTGNIQFMDAVQVDLAMVRPLPNPPDRFAPLVIGVDVARFGDDETVIFPRMGVDCRTWKPLRFKKFDTVAVTGQVIQCIREFEKLGIKCSGLFVDGGGIGGAVVDMLRNAGYSPFECHFGGTAQDHLVYRYKGDEMWGRLKDAMPRLCLPNYNEPSGTEIRRQLTQREFGYTLTGHKMHLETKRDMKERLGGEGASPDIIDALSLTWYHDVAQLLVPHGQQISAKPNEALHEYDPLEETW